MKLLEKLPVYAYHCFLEGFLVVVFFLFLFGDPISFSSPSLPVLSTKTMIMLPHPELFPMLHVLHTEKMCAELFDGQNAVFLCCLIISGIFSTLPDLLKCTL